jgi:hypothetical protein
MAFRRNNTASGKSSYYLNKEKENKHGNYVPLNKKPGLSRRKPGLFRKKPGPSKESSSAALRG